jgi:hypothetical protein
MRTLALGLAAALATGAALAHHNDEFDWHYNGEDGWNLAFYGIPDSGSSGIILRCEKPGTLKLTMDFASSEIGKRRNGEAIQVQVYVDMPEWQRKAIPVSGVVEKDESHGDTIIATVTTKHPLVAALTSGVATTMGTRTTWLPLKGASEVVNMLLEKCR